MLIKAFDEIERLYNKSVQYLKEEFESFAKGSIPKRPVSAFYPLIKFSPKTMHRNDARLSYGFVPYMGDYVMDVTRPDIFENYYREQINLLLSNHGGFIEVGYSETPIPIHFALGEYYHVEDDLNDGGHGGISINF